MRQFFREPQTPVNIALRISCAYAATGALWILFSATLLSLIISEPATLTRCIVHC
ncbi:MAG: hypothetical protein HZA15_04305 [Nitrospirae bacterium]|nr:hypothetical protein [Nitrospirota bacterium]